MHVDGPPTGVSEAEGRSSLGKVVFNFINAVVGSGVLAIPHALHEAGLVAGVTLACLIGSMTELTIRVLVQTGHVENVRNYEELMDKLFGFHGYAAISVLMFLYDFGAMLSYLIILGDVSSPIVSVICSHILGMSTDHGVLADYWTLRRICTILISVLLILPLCLHRDIAGLEKASQFSVFVTVVVIVIVVFATVSGDNCPDRDFQPESCPDTSKPWLTVIGKNPSTAFGILAFAFVAHDTAFMFHNSLKNATPARWNRATRLALGFSILICMAFAIPSFIAFRDKIDENVLENFAEDDYKILFVRLLFLLSMSFTYPICFFICRHIVNELVYRWQHRNIHRVRGTPAGLSIKNVPTSRHVLLTLGLFGTSLCIVCFVDQLGLVMSITGNVSAVSIAFILPPLCAMKSKRERFKHCICASPFSSSSATETEHETAMMSSDHGDSTVPLLPPSNTVSNYEGVQASEPRSVRQCDVCRKSLRWTYISNSMVLVFGVFTLLFCTIQTIAQAQTKKK